MVYDNDMRYHCRGTATPPRDNTRHVLRRYSSSSDRGSGSIDGLTRDKSWNTRFSSLPPASAHPLTILRCIIVLKTGANFRVDGGYPIQHRLDVRLPVLLRHASQRGLGVCFQRVRGLKSQ